MSNTSDLSLDKLIEYIDVGGPSMLRAAAKNFQSVITLCSPCMYEDFMIEFSKNSGKFDYDTRKKYARRVFLETSKYDSIIYNQFSDIND